MTCNDEPAAISFSVRTRLGLIMLGYFKSQGLQGLCHCTYYSAAKVGNELRRFQYRPLNDIVAVEEGRRYLDHS
jgi:hypothetical protein